MEIYVGVDDSNHSGDRKGDIILATFTDQKSYGLVKNLGKGRDTQQVAELLKFKEIDYRFAVLFDEVLRRIQPNLPLVAPFLIEDYLTSFPLPEKLKVFFDGQLKGWHKELLRERFEPRIGQGNLTINNFIKRQGVHNCPRIVYFADVLSNQVYGGTFDEIMENPRRVEVDESKLLDLLK